MMNTRTLAFFTAAVSAIPLSMIGAYLLSTASHAAAHVGKTRPTAGAADAPSLLPTNGSSAIVDAANAFLTTLSDKERAVAQIELTPENAGRWSNFPAAVVPRNGVYFRDMTAEQAAAAMKVARLALSEEGFNRFQEVRAADDAFGKSDAARRGPGGGGPGRPPGGRRDQGGPGAPGGPPPGGPPPGGPGRGPGGPGGRLDPSKLFGAGNYIIAFLGKPSLTEPWLLQLGGHHIAFNLYYKGTEGASTPYFVGVQPNTWTDANGKTHAPLAPLRHAMYRLVHSLTPEQTAQAHLNVNFNDVYVGPGRDGKFPTKSEGVSVSELSAASKDLVRQAIAAWTGDTAQAADYRKRYDAELDRTRVAYSGTTDIRNAGDYVRIDGPHVWIEFACQGSDHYHTIWRDRATDYGAEFSF